MDARKKQEEAARWYVMRDLKRHNAKLPAYRQLAEEGFRIFTPMRKQLSLRQGKRQLEEVPVIPNLLFVHATRRALDPTVERTPTLQYRYARGGNFNRPMVVADAEMERFIHAVAVSEKPVYLLPEEITPEMYGRRIRIVGGPLDGYEGCLLTTRGSKVKRLMVEIRGFLGVGVEVNPEYIILV